MVSDYGAHKELLRICCFLLLQGGQAHLPGRVQGPHAEEQKYIYYACGEDAGQLAKLPQAERIRDKGYEILYLTDEPDQFVIDALGAVDEVAFKSVDDADALPETDEEKAALEQKAEESKPVLDFLKETLGDAIKEARVSKILKSGAVCLTADGPITLEMEKYFQRVDPENAKSSEGPAGAGAQPRLGGLRRPQPGGGRADRDKAARYAKLLTPRLSSSPACLWRTAAGCTLRAGVLTDELTTGGHAVVVQKKVPSVGAWRRLHRLAYSVPDEVQVRSLDGAIAIDAKSSMGLFALDFSQPVEILTDSPAVLAELECWCSPPRQALLCPGPDSRRRSAGYTCKTASAYERRRSCFACGFSSRE